MRPAREEHPSLGLIRTALAAPRPRRHLQIVPKTIEKLKQTPIAFTVFGVAKPKGSKTAVRRGAKIILIEGTLGGATPAARRRASLRVKAIYDWAEQIAAETEHARDGSTLDGPLQVAAKIWLPCVAKNHVPGAWHTVPPDCDKLFRMIGDAIKQGGAIREDARIATWDGSSKRFCRLGEEPRVEIEIIPLRDPID